MIWEGAPEGKHFGGDLFHRNVHIHIQCVDQMNIIYTPDHLCWDIRPVHTKENVQQVIHNFKTEYSSQYMKSEYI